MIDSEPTRHVAFAIDTARRLSGLSAVSTCAILVSARMHRDLVNACGGGSVARLALHLDEDPLFVQVDPRPGAPDVRVVSA